MQCEPALRYNAVVSQENGQVRGTGAGYMRAFIVLWLAICGGLAGVAFLLGAAVMLWSGWPASAERWGMVQGVGQLAGAGFAMIALVGLFLAVAQLHLQEAAQRVDSMPYIRADLIYADGKDAARMLYWEAEQQIQELSRRVGGSRPMPEAPAAASVPTAATSASPSASQSPATIVLRRERSVEYDDQAKSRIDEVEALLRGNPGDPAPNRLRVALRVENQQQASLGLAQELTVGVHLWAWKGGPAKRPSNLPRPIFFDFPYVEPATAYMVPILDTEVALSASVMVEMAVADVRYRGLVGPDRSGCHGYLSLVIGSDDIPSGLEEFRVQDREVIP